MRQELLNDQASEINSLGNGLKEININEENDDDDSGQSTDATLLPISDQCDSKDKKVCVSFFCLRLCILLNSMLFLL